MNPLRRRGQILLALSAEHQGISTKDKQRARLRLKDAQELLELVESQIDERELDESLEKALKEKKSLLERKIREKKKDL